MLDKRRPDTTGVALGGGLDSHGKVKTIRFLSYNIFLRPPAPRFTHGVHDDLKDERLAIFKSRLGGYDVIALQECFGAFSFRRQQLIEEAQQQGFTWHVFFPLTFGFLVDGGLLLLSKFPISRSATVTFSRGKFSDALAAKGAIYARMQVAENAVLHIFSTHLQASYVGCEAAAAEVREGQFNELVQFISSCIKEEVERSDDGYAHRVALMGDLNVNGRLNPDSGDIPSEEYIRVEQVLQSLGPAVDILRGAYGHLPVTCVGAVEDGNGSLVQAEQVLTPPKPLHQTRLTLDYAWLIDPQHLQQQRSTSTSLTAPKVTAAGGRVNEMKVEESERGVTGLTHLSDHFAVEFELAVEQ